MLVPVTALHASLLAVIAIVLAGHAGQRRLEADVSLGDAGKPRLIEGIRRHANFVEFVPLTLAVLIIVEINGAPKWWLHLLGGVLVVSRVLHPFGLHYDRMRHPLRMVGTIGTFAVLLAAAATAAWQALFMGRLV